MDTARDIVHAFIDLPLECITCSHPDLGKGSYRKYELVYGLGSVRTLADGSVEKIEGWVTEGVRREGGRELGRGEVGDCPLCLVKYATAWAP